MSVKNLDLDTLRTLMVADDLGGYGQAAARLAARPPPSTSDESIARRRRRPK
jgi:hypothetical protein